MSPRVVLMGPPGAGKTTVGVLLAQTWGVAFLDTDAAVEAEAGMPVADIFVVQGEPAFRALEAAAVSRALGEHDGVLALGGGSILDPQTRTALAGRPVVFLDVGIADAAKRIGFNRERPLLLGNPRAQWLKLMEARRPLYESLATVTVDTAGRTPEEVVSAVREQVGQ